MNSPYLCDNLALQCPMLPSGYLLPFPEGVIEIIVPVLHTWSFLLFLGDHKPSC